MNSNTDRTPLQLSPMQELKNWVIEEKKTSLRLKDAGGLVMLEFMDKKLTELLSKESSYLQQKVLDAFEAGQNFEHALHFGKVPNPYPDKTQYLISKPHQQ